MTLKLWPETLEELAILAIARMKELDAVFRPDGNYNHYFYHNGYQELDRWLNLSTHRILRARIKHEQSGSV